MVWYSQTGTLAFIYMPNGLGIKSITSKRMPCPSPHLFESCGLLVNHCLDVRLDRECQWSRKISNIKYCEEKFTCDVKHKPKSWFPMRYKHSGMTTWRGSWSRDGSLILWHWRRPPHSAGALLSICHTVSSNSLPMHLETPLTLKQFKEVG